MTTDRTPGNAWSWVRTGFRLDIKKRLFSQRTVSRAMEEAPQESGHSTELDKSSRSLDRVGRHVVGIPGAVLCRTRSWDCTILGGPFQP